METQSVFLPSYSIGGSDVYKKVPDICRPYGTKAIVIGGEKAMAAAKEDLLAGVAGSDIEITGFLKYGDDVTYEAADALCANPDVQAADMIFAVGGGRATDTCKTAADKLDKPIFTFPTIASNCAAVTLVCVMHKPDRSLAGFHYRKEPAKHAFINLDIISKAPLEYIWAGIGDAFSKAYEPPFSAMNDELDHSNMIGVDLAKHCGEPLLKYAVQAYEDCKNQRISEALKQIVLNIIITGGIISTLIETEKYNGAIPHSIFYGSTPIPACEQNHLHGEIVAYACLPQLMHEQRMEDFERQFKINRALELPTSLAEIDIQIGSADYEKLLDGTMADRCMQYLPYPISRADVDDAIRKTEEYHNAHV